MQPSPYDVWSARDIVTLIGEAVVYKETLKSAFVINRKIVNTAIGRDVGEALASYPVPVLRASLSQRVAFAESAARGRSVLEDEPLSSAGDEMKELVNEILGMAA